tara:strand:- start:16946 stop:17350 length:405 start_codon:yes stop_codon:yes gene_type:complete
MSPIPEIFEQCLTVKATDLDEQKHVNNVQYVQWIQDIAKAHWESKANPEILNKYFWVVIRHEIDYKKQAFLNEEIILRTFVGEHTHVTSIRNVHILNKETSKILVKAKSTWCLMDSTTKKPVKISEELLRVFYK